MQLRLEWRIKRLSVAYEMFSMMQPRRDVKTKD